MVFPTISVPVQFGLLAVHGALPCERISFRSILFNFLFWPHGACSTLKPRLHFIILGVQDRLLFTCVHLGLGGSCSHSWSLRSTTFHQCSSWSWCLTRIWGCSRSTTFHQHSSWSCCLTRIQDCSRSTTFHQHSSWSWYLTRILGCLRSTTFVLHYLSGSRFSFPWDRLNSFHSSKIVNKATCQGRQEILWSA